MRLTIEDTPDVVSINGVPCRVWNGRTEAGVECKVLVRAVAVKAGEHAEFEAALLPLGDGAVPVGGDPGTPVWPERLPS